MASLTRSIRGLFATQVGGIAHQITAAIADTAKADGGDRIDRIIRRLTLDWSGLVPDAEQVLARMAEDGTLEALIQVGVDDPGITEQVNERALAWAKARAAELVGMRYNADGVLVENPDADWAITESTREMLCADVAQAIEDGTSTDDLAAQLADRYAFSDDRAATIARTEVARADVAGNLAAYQASGVVEGKEWLLGSEHDGPDECDEAEAMGVVPLDSDFGGVGDPPAHPRCACDILPVLVSAPDDKSDA